MRNIQKLFMFSKYKGKILQLDLCGFKSAFNGSFRVTFALLGPTWRTLMVCVTCKVLYSFSRCLIAPLTVGSCLALVMQSRA